MLRNRLAASLCALLASLCVQALHPAAAAGAQDGYPVRPVKLVVPFSAGGTTDLLARLLAKQFEASLGQPIIVENRAGAGSMLGTGYVAKAPADGYTLLLATSSSLVVAPVFTTASYDSRKDFTPISIVASSPFAVAVNTSVPAQNIAQLIALAKKEPGRLNMASFGTGSSSHLAGELFKAMAGIDMTHVPYKGSPQALADLMGGQVHVMFDMVSATLPHYRAGKLRLLGVTGKEPVATLPGVPTVQGIVPGYNADAWFGLVAPAGLPEAVTARLNEAVVQALGDSEIKELLAQQSLAPVGNSSAQFQRIIEEDLVKWTKVVKEANVQP